MKKIIIGKKDGDIALNQLSKSLDGLEVDFKNSIKSTPSKNKDKNIKQKKSKKN